MAAQRETSKHQEVFETWYRSHREFRKVSENLGIKSSTLYDWADRFHWHERANARDAEAQRIADAEAAKERAERQKQRRRAAELMTARGYEFFVGNKIDTPRDAIQAIRVGLDNERKEDGVPDWVMLILNADENELQKLARTFADAATGAAEAGGGDDSLSFEPDTEEE